MRARTRARTHRYTHRHKHTDTQTHISTSDTPADQHVPPCPQLAALMSSWPSPTCTIPIPYHCFPTPLPSYIHVPASLHPSSPHIITTPHHNSHMALLPHTIAILHHRCSHPHHPIRPSSPHTVTPRHPCYQTSLSCTTDLSVVVQHPHCTVALPPCAVTFQPPAQPCATSTQLPPTLHHPVPSVPHGIIAQQHNCPLAVVTLHHPVIPPLHSRPVLSPPHASHPIPSTPCNIATTTVPPPP
jgi:hypothetical protein